MGKTDDSKPKVSPGIKKGGGAPPGFEKRRSAFVYARPKSTDPPLKKESSKLQGVWTESFNAVNPVELWIFDKGEEPPSLHDSGHPVGAWGYTPGADPKKCAVEEMLFLPPKSKPPKFFTPKGFWSFPLVKRDDTVLKEKEAGFVHVGDHVKQEDLDVGGTWRMLYHRPGEDKPPPPPKNMMIFVKKPNGEKIQLTVKPTDTIDDIKSMVKDKSGIPKDEQRLRHKNSPLDDKPTLKDYGIQDGDILDLEPMEIYVKDPKRGKTYTLVVDPTDTIDQIKTKLENQESIPKDRQRLTFKGDPCDDKKNLRSHGIKHKSVLNLEPMTMTIFVQDPKGKKYTLENVEPTDTINQIKSKLESQEGIPKKKQRLTFSNKPCVDSKNLEDHGIKDKSVLHLSPMEIHVRTTQGKKITLDVEPTDTIEDIKNRVDKKENIPVADQRMSFGNRPLNNDKATLDGEGIKHGDTIDLGPMIIYVKDWKGKTISLEVEPTDDIEDIKVMIEKREGHPVEEQILKFQGKELENPKNLKEYGIKHKSTLDLSKAMPAAPPTPPQQTYVVQLSPYKSPLEAGYSPSKGNKKREGIRAKSKELLKNRWHADLATETQELGQMAAEKHRKAKNDG